MILAIYGAGGLGHEILDTAKAINTKENIWSDIIFINDFKEETVINGVEVFTFDEFKANMASDKTKITIAIGEPKVRQLLRNKVTSYGYKLQQLIHPSAFIGSRTQIGDGAIIQYGSFISCDVTIGENVLVQSQATVGHDSIIGADTVLSTFDAVSGKCKIGERVYIGISVPIKEGASIGADSIIGMGSVVIRDIPEGVIAIGNPARVMKNNESGRVFD